MKSLPLQLLLAAAIGLSGCGRKGPSTDAQREADEKRIAELRELEQRAAQRENDAQAAQLLADRQRLAEDQAALDAERAKLAQDKAAIQDDAERRARYEADERRLAQREAAVKAEQDRAAAAEREAQDRAEARQARNSEPERKLDFFYAALDPLGDWFEVEPYGYVWQPREAQSGGWRPYADGNWVYTDYGWTWKANEPFGWATYHYGRWARLRGRGWVWVPGSEWAPAWVSWRKSPEYVGWAPLPPEAHSGSGFNAGVDSYYDIGPASYNFVAINRIGEPTYRGLIVEPERNVTIINQTVNITQINYTKIDQRTAIFNAGPDLNQVNAVSARPIQHLAIQREADRSRVGGGSGAATVSGSTMRVFAPTIASAPRAAATPVHVKEKVAKPDLERGWGTGNDQNLQAIRTKMKQEAGEAETQSRRVPTGATFGPAVPKTTSTPAPLPKPVRPPAPEATPAAAPATPRSTPREFALPATPAPTGATPMSRPERPPRVPSTPEPGLPSSTPKAIKPLPAPDAPAAVTPAVSPIPRPRPVRPAALEATPVTIPATPNITPATPVSHPERPPRLPATPEAPLPPTVPKPARALPTPDAPAATTPGGFAPRPRIRTIPTEAPSTPEAPSNPKPPGLNKPAQTPPGPSIPESQPKPPRPMSMPPAARPTPPPGSIMPKATPGAKGTPAATPKAR